ncbi:hypothetical protein GF359_02645 [candidate division WOR-3 bacterium]|uniref:Tetratricopeptide repeat protein n=1 Tax=candidate division WOR-3 bacterium TaxID=2052148 RepID=A0A9D5QBY4_UNCW3|nr:hypothetical protein [candidate division WOR-3 bacterium]MBD3364093.1 hypothetical protein [candidate division WOR-3 bacterium]
MGGENTKALSVLDEVRDPGSMILPIYAYYLTKACILCFLGRYDEALDALAEGMRVTLDEDGCVPCFTNNCRRIPQLEPLRKPPYRERLEGIIGSKPKIHSKPETG